MSERLTDADLAAIRDREQQATKRPWHNHSPAYGDDRTVRLADDNGITLFTVAFATEQDAEFVSRARDDIPRLLAEVDRLRVERDGSRRQVNELNDILRRIGYGQGEIDSFTALIEEVEKDRDELRAAVERLLAENEKLLATAKSFAEKNTILRRIACHIPGKTWLQAKEECGYGNEIHAQINDAKADEAWLQFITSGKASE